MKSLHYPQMTENIFLKLIFQKKKSLKYVEKMNGKKRWKRMNSTKLVDWMCMEV